MLLTPSFNGRNAQDLPVTSSRLQLPLTLSAASPPIENKSMDCFPRVPSRRKKQEQGEEWVLFHSILSQSTLLIRHHELYQTFP